MKTKLLISMLHKLIFYKIKKLVWVPTVLINTVWRISLVKLLFLKYVFKQKLFKNAPRFFFVRSPTIIIFDKKAQFIVIV